MENSSILLLYASHDGHTRQIIRYLASSLLGQNLSVVKYNLDECLPPAFMLEEAYRVLVISPIRFGSHLASVERFLKKQKSFLKEDRLGLISINLTARKEKKNTPKTNPYYKKWLQQHGLNPTIQLVLAGRLDYKLYRPWEKLIIRFIMKITGGPTDPSTCIEYTDWEQVDALAEMLACSKEKQQECA